MPPILSNKELALASWLYEKRPLFHRIGFFSFLCIAAALALLILLNGVFVFRHLISGRAQFFAKTQSLVVWEDPSFLLAPKDLVAQNIIAVTHSGRGEDFFATVVNPNSLWAAFSLDYTFTAGGNAITSARSSYAFPGENSVVAFSSSPLPISSIEVRFANIRWLKIISPRDKERLKLFSIHPHDVSFIHGDKKEIGDIVRATMVNASSLSFWSVPVIALVLNNGVIKAVGEGSIDRFISGEDRELEIGFGVTDLVSASVITLIPRVNVLDGSAIMPAG